jgi:hypothetical protein
VSELTQRRFSTHVVNRLIEDAPSALVELSDDHRRSLSARFRATASLGHRRLDAWLVERAGRADHVFRWSPSSARRTLGNAALRRALVAPALTCLAAIDEEMDDQLARYLSGYARSGSLASYLASAPDAELGLVRSEAANWATQLAEIAQSIERPWQVAASDAYYDVARARTTLRGRRDLIVTRDDSRVLVRVRRGAPGSTAGPGLRSDLSIDAFAHPAGVSASRIVGVWPEAGVVLSVDGTMADLRAGARDLVRTAVVRQRSDLRLAA